MSDESQKFINTARLYAKTLSESTMTTRDKLGVRALGCCRLQRRPSRL